MTIREYPPTRLSISVTTPEHEGQSGVTTRWGWDDRNPIFAPKQMSFGTVMPGGFDRFTCTLQRKPQISYIDDEELSTLTVYGVGGTVAWQGRIEKLPDVGGFQSQESPEAVGWQAHLEDDQGAREIYVDKELNKWESSHTERKKVMIVAGWVLYDPAIESGVEGGEVTKLPMLGTTLRPPWSSKSLSEAWYDSRGIPLEYFGYTYRIIAYIGAADPEWTATAYLLNADEATGDEAANTPVKASYENVMSATAFTRVYAVAQVRYAKAYAENANQSFALYWRVAVYGRHSLTRKIPPGGDLSDGGLLACDIVNHAIHKFAPKIKSSVVSEGVPLGTISKFLTAGEAEPFIVPQLVFLEPTTAAEIIKQATRFGLPDWAVWEGPTFYMNPRGERAKKWRSRVGPAQLQEAGPQISRIWNYVVVQYTDAAGKTRTIGPPAPPSGAYGNPIPVEHIAVNGVLNDLDPTNPANEAGIVRCAVLKMGTSTLAGAERVGEIFLAEQKKLEGSGQAVAIGTVESTSGVLYPAWAVRAGDEISFIDAAEPGYRRVVNTSYDDSSRTNTLQLDQPPDGMQQLLERLSVVLVPLGVT